MCFEPLHYEHVIQSRILYISSSLSSHLNSVKELFYVNQTTVCWRLNPWTKLFGFITIIAEETSVPSSQVFCGRNITSSLGSISPPKLLATPSNYRDNLNCSWTLAVPSGYINVEIYDLHIECDDSLKVSYSSLHYSSHLHGIIHKFLDATQRYFELHLR